MAQEETVVLTPEQEAAAKSLADNGGRVADLDAAAAKQQAAAAAALKEESPDDVELKKKEDDAAAAKAEEEKTKEPEVGSDEWKKQWIETGNPHADSAIGLMQKAGMTPVEGNAVFAKAIASGDLNDVDWDVLEARLGKDTALLARTGIEQYYNTEYKAQQAIQTYAYDQVGGEKSWGTIQTWAKAQEKADPAFAAELNEWRSALKVGGFAAKAAVDAIKAKYESAPGNTSIKRDIVRGDKLPNDSGTGDKLSRSEYYSLMEKAGGDRAPDHVKRDLQARRNAGREAGL